MDIITLSSDEESSEAGSTLPPKKNWVPPNKRYPKGFRFFLPSLSDEAEKSEQSSEKGTIQFSVYKCFSHKNVKTWLHNKPSWTIVTI